MTTPSLVTQQHCLLGEGPLWHAGVLYWVDIKQNFLYGWRAGQVCQWHFHDFVCWLIPRQSTPSGEANHFVLGLRHHIALVRLLWPHSTETKVVGRVEILAQRRILPTGSALRLNDAKADAQGRIWFGTMHNEDEQQTLGQLLCLQADLSVTVLDEQIHIPNGPTFSPDGRYAYHADSARRMVFVYQLDASGAIVKKSEWLRFTQADGYPDGMTTDSAGEVWIAHWGAACVTRHQADGQEVQRLKLPAQQPTSLTFGGADLATLFITSAHIGLAQKLAGDGALFSYRPAAAGLAARPFQG